MAPEDDECLQRIARAKGRADSAQDWLALTVREAREAGMPWGQIATMLGTSRQAAAERYGSTK